MNIQASLRNVQLEALANTPVERIAQGVNNLLSQIWKRNIQAYNIKGVF